MTKSNDETPARAEAYSGAPKGIITDTMKAPLPKRFYKSATASQTAPYQILLDGRAVKTPKKRALALPTLTCAEAIAAEWAAQTEFIDPASMPFTRFANTAIDAVADTLPDVAADIVAYAGRDLLCYRAEGPADLARLQAAKWDPVLSWAKATLGADFEVVAGIMPIDQPLATLDGIAQALLPLEPFRLTALHVMTTLTGSAILTVAHTHSHLTAAEAWAAAHVDEDYQIALWGVDDEAAHRRKLRAAEFLAASTFIELVTVRPMPEALS